MAKIKSHWVKTTPFGNYENTEDRVNARTSSHVHIIREARALGINGRHAGSKPTSKLLKGIARAHKAMAPSEVMSPEEEIQTAKKMKKEDQEI
jgi:hypothetical protein